jgi:hypothetical protein
MHRHATAHRLPRKRPLSLEALEDRRLLSLTGLLGSLSLPDPPASTAAPPTPAVVSASPAPVSVMTGAVSSTAAVPLLPAAPATTAAPVAGLVDGLLGGVSTSQAESTTGNAAPLPSVGLSLPEVNVAVAVGASDSGSSLLGLSLQAGVALSGQPVLRLEVGADAGLGASAPVTADVRVSTSLGGPDGVAVGADLGTAVGGASGLGARLDAGLVAGPVLPAVAGTGSASGPGVSVNLGGLPGGPVQVALSGNLPSAVGGDRGPVVSVQVPQIPGAGADISLALGGPAIRSSTAPVAAPGGSAPGTNSTPPPEVTDAAFLPTAPANVANPSDAAALQAVRLLLQSAAPFLALPLAEVAAPAGDNAPAEEQAGTPAAAGPAAAVGGSATPAAEEQEPQPEGADLEADYAPYAARLEEDLQRILGQLDQLGSDLNACLSSLGLSPWVWAALAVAVTAGEAARRQLRRPRWNLALGCDGATLTGLSGTGDEP